MKRGIKALVLGLAIAVVAPAALAQTKLKWAHVYETSEPYHTAAVWAAGEIKKRTNGRYDVEVFPASSLGKETAINQGLTLGTVDIIYTGQLFAGRTHGPLAIGGAPYMFRDFNHWSKFRTSPLFRELADGYQKKGGTTGLMGVFEYANPVTARGMVFMDTPGYDPVSATGQVAGGANLICFTTGRGSVYGCKPAPSLKLATNTPLYERMEDDMDINCGAILDGGMTVDEAGEKIFRLILATASGEPSKSEKHGFGADEFVPWQLGAVM